MPENKDTRHPYTYAADYIRQLVPHQFGEDVKLSRAEASRIRQGIAAAIGMPDEELAEKLSLYFLRRIEQVAEEGALETGAAVAAVFKEQG